MGGKSAPPPPDYAGAAREQSEIGRQLTAEQTYANRPNIVTPFGSLTWERPTYDPWFDYGEGAAPGAAGGVGGVPAGGGGEVGGGGWPGWASWARARGAQSAGGGTTYGGPPEPWTMNIELSPAQQAALEAQQALGAERSGLGLELFGRAREELGEAPDWAALPEGAQALSDIEGLPETATTRERAEEALYGRAARRLDPEWSRRAEQLSAQLANQGIVPGSAAHTQAMQEFERARGEAYAGAREQAIIGGGAEEQRALGLGIQRGRYGREAELEAGRYEQARREAAIAEELQRRGWSLNEVNALLSGQQVGMPQFPGFAQAGAAAAPNLLGAAGQQYAAQLQSYGIDQAQQAALMSGLFGLGAAAIPFAF